MTTRQAGWLMTMATGLMLGLAGGFMTGLALMATVFAGRCGM